MNAVFRNVRTLGADLETPSAPYAVILIQKNVVFKLNGFRVVTPGAVHITAFKKHRRAYSVTVV